MDATSWQEWLKAVVTSEQQYQQEMKRISRERYEKMLAERSSTNIPVPQAPLFPLPISPVAVWSGEPSVQERLKELWDQFHHSGTSNQRQEWEQRLHRKVHQIERLTEKHLWNRLEPYHKRIPGLVIHLVSYPAVVDMVIEPQTLLLGINESAIDGSLHIARIERGAEALASGVQPTNLPLQLPKVPAITPNPGMAQARPLSEIIARLPEDDPKRELLEHSHLRHEYGNEPIIIEFTHIKIQPHFCLYQFMLENAENEHFQYTAYLQPTEQNNWRLKHISGGLLPGGSSLFPALPDLLKTHPRIDLQGGQSYSQSNNNREYTFTAWGEIHDNGFGVTRVVLSNTAGQRLEDTVEDNFVAFFASPDKVECPLQAEFYNQADQLVGTQTVFDDDYHKRL
jgi:hypothetical protein